MVPELLLIHVIQLLLTLLTKDARLNTQVPSESLVYKLFSLIKAPLLERVNIAQEAFTIFSRKPSDSRALNLDLSYRLNPDRPLSMFLTLGQEQYGANSIGQDQDEEIIEGSNSITVNKRVFGESHNLYIYSDSYVELMAAYHVVKLGLVSVLDTLGVLGFQNITISGQDVSPSDLIPKHLFFRVIVIKYDNEIAVPTLFKQKLVQEIIISGLPIVIENEQ